MLASPLIIRRKQRWVGRLGLRKGRVYEQYSLYGHSVRRFDGERLDDQRKWAILLSGNGRTGYVGHKDWVLV